MFFYNGALLMEAGWFDIARALVTALFGVYMLSGGVMGWFADVSATWVARLLLVGAALLMIAGGLVSDLAGIAVAVMVFMMQRQRKARLAAA